MKMTLSLRELPKSTSTYLSRTFSQKQLEEHKLKTLKEEQVIHLATTLSTWIKLLVQEVALAHQLKKVNEKDQWED